MSIAADGSSEQATQSEPKELQAPAGAAPSLAAAMLHKQEANDCAAGAGRTAEDKSVLQR